MVPFFRRWHALWPCSSLVFPPVLAIQPTPTLITHVVSLACYHCFCLYLSFLYPTPFLGKLTFVTLRHLIFSICATVCTRCMLCVVAALDVYARRSSFNASRSRVLTSGDSLHFLHAATAGGSSINDVC